MQQCEQALCPVTLDRFIDSVRCRRVIWSVPSDRFRHSTRIIVWTSLCSTGDISTRTTARRLTWCLHIR